MNNDESTVQHTQHAFLVAWGWFAEHLGLLTKIQSVSIRQKQYQHPPQAKVLEFLVATLAGLKYLQDISLAAHPLDKDLAVAQAWGQCGWADYSGVSRTLQGLTGLEVRQIAQVLDEISQPYLTAELNQLRTQKRRVCYDGDLTGLPVSNTSQTYPQAAYGHMDDEIRLGYQAAVVSLASPTYGRLWLSIAHHPGDTVSCTQAEALVLAAEAHTGVKPRRRTEQLQQRLQRMEPQLRQTTQRLATQQHAVQSAYARVEQVVQQAQTWQRDFDALQVQYQRRHRSERPTSRLAQARKRVQTAPKRLQSRMHTWHAAERRRDKTQAQLEALQVEWQRLQKRLTRLEQDNLANPTPVQAEFRLDAGFGSYANVALLIEMGYEVYTKPHSHQVVAYLQRQVNAQTTWDRVGANAEVVVWHDLALQGSPYPVDVALERFYTGQTLKHSALLHYGGDAVTANPTAWFEHYNQRQTIEAGIKESKQVFALHRIKVRAEPAIILQECFVVFAANFIRWAAQWLAIQAAPGENALQLHPLGLKRQVQVGAHVSAQVIQNSEGRFLRFSEQSAFAGKTLQLACKGYPP